MWIDDYQGRYSTVAARAQNLLETSPLPGLAALLGPVGESGIWHRLGRAKVEHGERAGDLDLAAEGLGDLIKGRRLGGQNANLYHDLWIARGALITRSRRAKYLKDKAWRLAETFGLYVPAHMHIVEGRLLRHEEPVGAISQLLPALEMWRGVHYVKGAFDVSWELARAYIELGRPGDREEAVRYLLLCQSLSQRLGDPRFDRVKYYLRHFALPKFGKQGLDDRRLTLEATESSILKCVPTRPCPLPNESGIS
jgi:hypothetical protein